MANCGNCGAAFACTCVVINSESVDVMGSGQSSAPYEFRPASPTPTNPRLRYAGHAFQHLGGQLFFANTTTLVTLTRDALAPLTGGNMWDSSLPNRLTAPIDGLYLISAQATRTDESFWEVWIAKNGITSTPLVKRSTALPAGPNAALLFLSVTTLVRLNASDYIELYVRSGATSITIGTIGVGSLIGVDAGPFLAAQWIGA